MDYESIKQVLEERGQSHLLNFFHELNEEEKKRYLVELSKIDWKVLTALRKPNEKVGKEKIRPIRGLNLSERKMHESEYYEVGKNAILSGKVGAVLLAGGQGTRLGVEGPKGCYNIGITRPVYIFERLIENLLEVCKSCRAYVPLYIMTSDKNCAETERFFREHDYFGYPEMYVSFFRQDMAPAVGFNGKILMEEKGRLALSPNGNGGWYSSLRSAGLTADIARRGIEWLNVFSVDNVLQRIADPVFIGATIVSGMACGAKVVSKTVPEEKVGVLCMRGKQPGIIEYYEISEELASQRNEEGELLYRYGVTLNYLFRLDRLNEIAKKRLPPHVVKKKVPYVNEEGILVKPEKENGYKFESLILDMIKHMGSCLPYEVEREKEFAPVKNLTGVDSVESARELLRKNGIEL